MVHCRKICITKVINFADKESLTKDNGTGRFSVSINRKVTAVEITVVTFGKFM